MTKRSGKSSDHIRRFGGNDVRGDVFPASLATGGGSDSGGWIEALLRETRNPSAMARRSGTEKIGKLSGTPGVDARLRELLDDADSGVRFLAVSALRGSTAVPAVSRLVAMVADSSETPAVRGLAASSVCSTGLRPEGLVEAAMSALESENVRAAAKVPTHSGHVFRGLCEALRYMVPESRKALPLLREMAKGSWREAGDAAIGETLQAIEQS